MTLRGQLFLGISAIFLLIFVGLFGLSGQSSRAYLERQLASQAADSAMALSLRISPALAKNDISLADTLVSTTFDRGYFQRIVLISEHGEILISKELPVVVEGVPRWFSALVKLEIHPGEALLSSGWRQFGKVVVISQPTLAYQHLWRNAEETFFWLFGTMLVSTVLLYLFLRVILNPLKKIELATKAMSERRFEQIATLPDAKELRQVVVALNDASLRISRMLDAEVEKAERYRQEAYQDEITGLENRRSFDLRVAELFDGSGAFSVGFLLMLELDGLKQFNVEHGYLDGNELLLGVAHLAMEQLGPGCSVMARIRGQGFAFIYLDGDHDALNARIKHFRSDALDKRVPASVSFVLGGAEFSPGENRAAVMARADLALEKARQQGERRYEWINLSQVASSPAGSKAWRDFLNDALACNRLKLMAQPVVSLADGKILNHEITGVLFDENGERYCAAMFVPMAQRHDFSVHLDKAIIGLALSLMDGLAARGIREFGVILSPQSIGNPGFHGWLESRLSALGREGCSRLSFNVGELAYSRNTEKFEDLRQLAVRFGAKICIDHFGLGLNSLDLLRRVVPNCARLSWGLVTELLSNEDTRRIVASIVQVAQSLDITIVAPGIESEAVLAAVREAGVDAAQGFYLGKPEPVEPRT